MNTAMELGENRLVKKTNFNKKTQFGNILYGPGNIAVRKYTV